MKHKFTILIPGDKISGPYNNFQFKVKTLNTNSDIIVTVFTSSGWVEIDDFHDKGYKRYNE